METKLSAAVGDIILSIHYCQRMLIWVLGVTMAQISDGPSLGAERHIQADEGCWKGSWQPRESLSVNQRLSQGKGGQKQVAGRVDISILLLLPIPHKCAGRGRDP